MRNNYGENDKSSRKNIPRMKRRAWRADRRRGRQELASLAVARDSIAGAGEERLGARVPARVSWRSRKVPDRPLGEQVLERLSRRVRLGMDHPGTAAARIGKVRRRRQRQPSRAPRRPG